MIPIHQKFLPENKNRGKHLLTWSMMVALPEYQNQTDVIRKEIYKPTLLMNIHEYLIRY